MTRRTGLSRAPRDSGAALVIVRAEATDRRLARSIPSDSYLFMRVLVFVLLIVTLDVTNVLDTGNAIRYLFLLVPFGGAFVVRFRSRSSLIRRPVAADKILLALFIFGGVGSAFGRVFLHTSSTALPIFVPMTMAFLYLFTREDPTEDEVRKILFALAAVGLLYVFMNAVANSGAIPTLQASRTYRNAQVMYVALGFAAVMFTRRHVRLGVFVLLAAFVFATYPSATSMLVAFSTLMTFFATRPHGTRIRFYLAGFVILSLLVVALFNFSKTTQIAGDYFSAAGKRDNTNARVVLWEAGLQRFARSPLYGDAFTGEVSVLVYRQAGSRAPIRNPYNDDYIQFAAGGGALALLLLLSWIVWVETTAIRRHRGFVASGQHYHALVLRALLVGFNA
ncbi:MAG: hypothetical protein ACXVJT_19055, partial [Thermoanaerobaculia bacterium]